jgi:hypothetical protein
MTAAPAFSSSFAMARAISAVDPFRVVYARNVCGHDPSDYYSVTAGIKSDPVLKKRD